MFVQELGNNLPPVKRFNPDPVINICFLDRVCRLNCGPQNCKEKRMTVLKALLAMKH